MKRNVKSNFFQLLKTRKLAGHRVVRDRNVFGKIVAPLHASHLLQHARDHHHRGGRGLGGTRSWQTSDEENRKSDESDSGFAQPLLRSKLPEDLGRKTDSRIRDEVNRRRRGDHGYLFSDIRGGFERGSMEKFVKI